MLQLCCELNVFKFSLQYGHWYNSESSVAWLYLSCSNSSSIWKISSWLCVSKWSIVCCLTGILIWYIGIWLGWKVNWCWRVVEKVENKSGGFLSPYIYIYIYSKYVWCLLSICCVNYTKCTGNKKKINKNKFCVCVVSHCGGCGCGCGCESVCE